MTPTTERPSTGAHAKEPRQPDLRGPSARKRGHRGAAWRLGFVCGVCVWMMPSLGWPVSPGTTHEDAPPRSADELKRDYQQLDEQGEYHEAALLAERACTILLAELGKSSPEYGKCLSDLAVLHWKQGEYERARSIAERALAIVERALGPNHLDVAIALNDLAVVCQARGEYEKAELLFVRALGIKEGVLGSRHASVATSLNNLAQLYSDQGMYEEAEPLFVRALAVREEVLDPDHPDIAQTLNNLALVHSRQGAYKKAEPLLMRALVAQEKKLGVMHPSLASYINNLANLYHDQGMFTKAESLYERTLAVVEVGLGPGHPLYAATLNNLGTLHDEQGEYEEGRVLHERALAIRMEALGPDHPKVAQSLHNLAMVYEVLGEHEKAEPMYERALAINERALGPLHPDIAHGLNALAMFHTARGSYEEAEALVARALTIRTRALGPDHPDVARSLNALANLYQLQGAHEEAEPLRIRVLTIREAALGPLHPLVAESLSNLALLYDARGEHERARSLFERALAVREKTLGPRHPVLASSIANLAKFHHDQGNHDLALSLQRRALDIEEVNLATTLVVADESRRRAHASALSGSLQYALSLHLRAKPDHHSLGELALATLLRRKSRVQDVVAQSSAVLRRSLPEASRHLLDDLSDVDSRIAVLSSRGPGRLTVEAFAQQLDRLGQQRNRLWNELAEHGALLERLNHSVTIGEVQRSLSAGSTLVELAYYVPQHDDAGLRVRPHDPKPPARYAAYLVFPDRFDWVDLGPAAPIDAHVAAFRRALQLEQPIPTDLYRAVMQPILARLPEDTRRLVIAPDGALNLVPFGALFDGERYLVEQYALRYVTTGRDLLPPVRDPVTTSPVTVVANPLGADLSGAELEADVLAGLFPDVRLLRQADATETALRTVERPLVLHMATHGFFGPALHERDNPMLRSGIHLADVDQLEDATIDRELDDGRLTAYEVSGWDLRGTQLVVLSACETGLGALHTGEGVLGLRRAFAMAGAQTQVMSLWQVGDVTTQKLMTAYYRALAGGMGRGEAMQAVQLEMLRTKEHHHPHDWAAFVVTGDDAPMTFPAGQEPAVAHAEDPEPGPPPHRARRGGCSTTGAAPDEGTPAAWLLLGVLGVAARRRRSA